MAVDRKKWPEPKYINNVDGEPVEVILSIEEYRALRDAWEDEADSELLQHLIDTETEFIPLEQVRAEFEAKHGK